MDCRRHRDDRDSGLGSGVAIRASSKRSPMGRHERAATKGPVAVSRQLGDLIGEVVLAFAGERDWGPDSYDLWYQGEPLWFLRQSSAVGPHKLLVRRVQVAAFDTDRGMELQAIPDAYLYDSDARKAEASVSPGTRLEGRHTESLTQLEQGLAHGKLETARAKLRVMIEAAWSVASELEV